MSMDMDVDFQYILDTMSLEEKVGQLFQIGFKGAEVTTEVKEMITDYYVGGIIYFSRNIKSPDQVAALSRGLQKAATSTPQAIPLIISTDQEGGIVTRVKGATHFPGNMSLGATRDKELAFEAGKQVARELKALGINMDLAPVLDVNNNPDNPVIGVRSYGEDPQLVAEMGSSFISGMQSEGVIACGKHFPGHGDTDTDSHLALPVIKHERKRLEEIEFYPFKKAFNKGLDTVMTAHVYFPAIEPEEGIPATLSQQVLTDLLRDELGFEGVVVTDCLEMKAIADNFGTVEAAVRTVKAGSDMVLISHTIEKAKKAIKAIIDAVKKGEISEERIDASVLRILRLKEKRFGLASKPEQLVSLDGFDTEAGAKLAYEIAKKGITLVKNKEGLVPVPASAGKKVNLIDFSMGRVTLVEDGEKIDNPMVTYLEEEGYEVNHITISGDRKEIIGLKMDKPVIFCTYDAIHHKNQVKVYRVLKEMGVSMLVIALRNPYDINVLPGVKNYLTTYDPGPYNLKAAVDVLTGNIEAQGELPISLE